MKKIIRTLSIGVLTLILLAACAGQEESPTAVGTTIPDDQTTSPPPAGTDTTRTAITSPEATLDTTATIDTATLPASTDTTQTAATDTIQTAKVPVTGADPILLECQFCIEGMAHALLVLADTATFKTVADTVTLSTPGPDVGCNIVDTYNGRQVVICRYQENTSLSLNICVDGNNCTQLLVELRSCPQTGTPQSGVTDTPGPEVPTNTPGTVFPTSTTGAGVTDTPAGVVSTVTP